MSKPKVYREVVSNLENKYENEKNVFRKVSEGKGFDNGAVLYTKEIDNLYIIPQSFLTVPVEGDSFIDELEKRYGKIIEQPYEISITSAYKDDVTSKYVEIEDEGLVVEYVRVCEDSVSKKRNLFGMKKHTYKDILTYVDMKLVGTYAMYKKGYISINTDEINATIFRKDDILDNNLINKFKAYPLKEFIVDCYGEDYLNKMLMDGDILINMTLENCIPKSVGYRLTKQEQDDYYMVNVDLDSTIPTNDEIILVSGGITYIDSESNILANITQYLTRGTFETRVALHRIEEDNEYRLMENINVYTDINDVLNPVMTEDELIKLSTDIVVDIKNKLSIRLKEYRTKKLDKLVNFLSYRSSFAVYCYTSLIQSGDI